MKENRLILARKAHVFEFALFTERNFLNPFESGELQELASRALIHDAFTGDVSSENSVCYLYEFFGELSHERIQGWFSFPDIVKHLTLGEDKRFLQLAVQFLSAGSRIDESVIAADYDLNLIQELKLELEKKSNS